MEKRKPLPQFTSLEEAKAFYGQYGKLEFFGRAGRESEYCVYTLHVRDGRKLRLFIHLDGKVEYAP